MLQSFIGTCDTAGLRTLRHENEQFEQAPRHEPGSLPFWAVLDSKELPTIEQALILGQRQRALYLLVAMAKSLGPVGS